MYLDKLHSPGAGYWKRIKTRLVIEEYRIQIKMPIERVLRGTITNNNWWYELKRANKYVSVRYNVVFVIIGHKREQELFKILEEATRTGISFKVKVKGLELNQHMGNK